MFLERFTIYTYLLCIKTVLAQHDATTTEDLVEQYYSTTPVTIDYSVLQDDTDAQAIVDSRKNHAVIASILPYRDKIRRNSISSRILTKVKEKNRKDYWIRDDFWPLASTTFNDLCYGLIKHENIVLGGYLSTFLYVTDETWAIICMVLIKDIQSTISTYESVHDQAYKIKDLRDKQRHPFQNMLKVWLRENRELLEEGELNHDNIVKDANALKEEQDHGGWHTDRDQIELILMKKSIKYARAVIGKFEKAYGNKAIEDIITENVKLRGLNHDLADAYASLARYIKNKYKYIAGILRQYSEGNDSWAAWIVSIAVVHPQEWPKIDEAFKKDYPGDSLSKFILQKMTDDNVMAEMIAAIVDPNFKPNTFSEKKVQKDPTSEHPNGMPPPVPPTTLASTLPL